VEIVFHTDFVSQLVISRIGFEILIKKKIPL